MEMSLNWYVANIKNSDDVCWLTATKNSVMDGRVRGEEYLHPITNTLIWATMAIGLSEITEKNVDEWEARYALAYKVGWLSPLTVWNGEPVGPDGKNAHCFTERYITRADLEQHIGLSTNANDESASAWRKRVIERITEEALSDSKYRAEKNVGIDAIWQKEGIELRDRIRRGETTKEKEALSESQPND
jgi:hypothetical protein